MQLGNCDEGSSMSSLELSENDETVVKPEELSENDEAVAMPCASHCVQIFVWTVNLTSAAFIFLLVAAEGFS